MEQPLPVGAVCLLGALNLTQFIKNGDWDYNKLYKIINLAVRMLDNVNDITYVPLEHQRENLKNKRRIGLGITGYGSALMMMQLRYGSEEAIRKTDDLMYFIMNHSYEASALLAKEKGAFPLYEAEKYIIGEHVKKLDTKVLSLIEKYGVRNSHLNTIAPTGNTGILANNVSGGLEPVFLPEYKRTSICPNSPEGLKVPTAVDFVNKTTSAPGWEWIMEGDVPMLKTEFDGKVYKIDSTRGLCVENLVEDYAVSYLKNKGLWDPNADWAATTTTLSADEHIKTMRTFAYYIDSAMSKTINLPRDYSYDDFKTIYSKLHSYGIKGGTTYREGTMTSVLSSADSTPSKDNTIKKSTAPKRPASLKCHVKRVKIKGEVFDVIVGLMGNDPYEVFVINGGAKTLCDVGTVNKIKSGIYNLITCKGEKFSIVQDVTDSLTEEEEAITRLVSTSLRHGADIKFIVEQLQKPSKSLTSFNKAIARVLKTYIKDGSTSGSKCPECGGDLIYQEGCLVCPTCGMSKCS